MELHPDKNPGDSKAAEKFALLQAAKDVLYDDNVSYFLFSIYEKN